MGKTKELFMQIREQTELIDDEFWCEQFLKKIDKERIQQTNNQINKKFYSQLKTKTNDKH